MYKKVLALSSVLVMALSLCACANDGGLNITFKRKDTSAVLNSVTEEVTEAEEATDEPETTTEATTEPIGDIYAATQEVNIRIEPDFDAQILGQLAYGQQILVLGIADGWAEVDYNGTAAYISVEYLVQVEQ